MNVTIFLWENCLEIMPSESALNSEIFKQKLIRLICYQCRETRDFSEMEKFYNNSMTDSKLSKF